VAEVGLVGVVAVGEWAVMAGEWVVMVGVERGEAVVVRVEVGHGVAVVEAEWVEVEHDEVAVGAEWVEAVHVGEEGVELVAGEHGAEAGAEWAAGVVVVVLEGVASALDRKGLVAALGGKGLEEHRCLEEGRRGRGSRGREG
jgi:hypothetical protein